MLPEKERQEIAEEKALIDYNDYCRWEAENLTESEVVNNDN